METGLSFLFLFLFSNENSFRFFLAELYYILFFFFFFWLFFSSKTMDVIFAMTSSVLVA